MYHITLDWLSVTFKEQTHEMAQFYDTYANYSPVVSAPALFGYSDANRDANGVVRMWSFDRSEMGSHAIFSGSSLAKLQSLSIAQSEVLRSALHAGATISRLDL